MSTNQEFFVTLPSNVKTGSQFEYNTISNYKTTLSRRLDFPQNEKWRVGLAEISYTKSWYNLRKKIKVEFFGKDGELFDAPYEDTVIPKYVDIIKVEKDDRTAPEVRIDLTSHASIYINPGYYKNCEELVGIINIKLNEMEKFIPKAPYLIFDKYDHYVTVIPGFAEKDFYPDFGEEIENIFGLINSKSKKSLREMTKHNWVRKMKKKNSNKYMFEFEPAYDFPFDESDQAWLLLKYRGNLISEMNMACRSLYVYSNILEHTFVGNSSVQLLRSVEVSDKKLFGDFVNIIYDKPHFHPLSTYSFDTIEIDIKDDTDTRVPFMFGRVTCKLVFRKDDDASRQFDQL